MAVRRKPEQHNGFLLVSRRVKQRTSNRDRRTATAYSEEPDGSPAQAGTARRFPLFPCREKRQTYIATVVLRQSTARSPMAVQRKPEQHDGFLFFPVARSDRPTSRPSYCDGLQRGARWQSSASRNSTTVSSFSLSREATDLHRDRRIPVLPELPKLEKRVRLPSVALEDASLSCSRGRESSSYRVVNIPLLTSSTRTTFVPRADSNLRRPRHTPAMPRQISLDRYREGR